MCVDGWGWGGLSGGAGAACADEATAWACCMQAPLIDIPCIMCKTPPFRPPTPHPRPTCRRRPVRSSPFPKRVLVVSPHPDDDVISMGGTLIRLVDQVGGGGGRGASTAPQYAQLPSHVQLPSMYSSPVCTGPQYAQLPSMYSPEPQPAGPMHHCCTLSTALQGSSYIKCPACAHSYWHCCNPAADCHRATRCQWRTRPLAA